jgi:hypothetical protein
MAPFDTNQFVTAWIPLRPIRSSETDSGLLFAACSHRDFALPFWHDLEGRALDDRGYELKDTGESVPGQCSLLDMLRFPAFVQLWQRLVMFLGKGCEQEMG